MCATIFYVFEIRYTKVKKLSIDTLDNAEIYHVYDYYDEPICYSIKLGNKYFVVFYVDYQYFNQVNVWLYLPATKNILTKLEQDKSTFGEYYKTHQNVSVLVRYEKVKQDTSNAKDDSILCTEKLSKIYKPWLPDEDEAL